jgi:hypothetical protein
MNRIKIAHKLRAMGQQIEKNNGIMANCITNLDDLHPEHLKVLDKYIKRLEFSVKQLDYEYKDVSDRIKNKEI